jgi:hypothetical protein
MAEAVSLMMDSAWAAEIKRAARVVNVKDFIFYYVKKNYYS